MVFYGSIIKGAEVDGGTKDKPVGICESYSTTLRKGPAQYVGVSKIRTQYDLNK